MRAQNAPPETVVRLVRGAGDGEPTDIPGAFRVERVDERALAEGRVWPQSRGSQLAALAVESQEGERVLDSCAAPGGKATMLHGDVAAVEVNDARARELEENARRLRATNVTSCAPTPPIFRATLPASTARSSTHRARALASSLARPDLRWRATATT